jgi:hypothetical protein
MSLNAAAYIGWMLQPRDAIPQAVHSRFLTPHTHAADPHELLSLMDWI